MVLLEYPIPNMAGDDSPAKYTHYNIAIFRNDVSFYFELGEAVYINPLLSPASSERQTSTN